MAMPFKMIFAIFLIIVFVVFAFIAIKGFLKIGETSNVGLFYEELQESVNNAMREQSSSFDFKIDLPGGITHICFANLSADITNTSEPYSQIKFFDIYNANTFLVPPEKSQDMAWKLIDNINITKITATSNPYCISTKKDLKIKKDFYDRLVTIE